MADTVGMLYINLLRSPELPAVTQRRIFSWATRNKNVVALASLAGHPQLVIDLDDILGTSGVAKVKAAWLTRPDRDTAKLEAALKGEKRISVLITLAGRKDLPEVCYGVLASFEHIRVACAVIDNKDAPFEHRVTATRTWAMLQFDGANRHNSKWTMSKFDRHPELHDTLAGVLDESYVLSYVGGSELSPAHQHRVIDKLIELAGKLDAMAKADKGTPNTTLAAVLCSYLVEAVQALAGNLCIEDDARAKLIAGLDDVKITADAGIKAKIDAARAFLAKTVPIPMAQRDHIVAANTDNVDEMTRLVAALAAKTDPKVSHALACNPNITVTIARALSRHLGYGPGVRAALAVHAGRTDIQAALLSGTHVHETALASTANPSEVLIAIIADYVQSGRVVPDTLLQSKFMTRAVVGYLPVGFATSPTMPPPLITLVMERLHDRLGDNPALWELFEGISGESNKSIDDTADACRLLLGLDIEDQAPELALTAPEAPEPETSREQPAPDAVVKAPTTQASASTGETRAKVCKTPTADVTVTWDQLSLL